MAENEKKDLEQVEKKARKTKTDTPSVWTKIGNWFKGLRSEWKKISWMNFKSVKSSTLIVLVFIIIFAIVIGVLDLAFGNAISGLSKLVSSLRA